MATASDIVDAIDTAILALVTGKIQSYSVGSQSFAEHDLRMLYDRKERPLRRIAQSSHASRRTLMLSIARLDPEITGIIAK